MPREFKGILPQPPADMHGDYDEELATPRPRGSNMGPTGHMSMNTNASSGNSYMNMSASIPNMNGLNIGRQPLPMAGRHPNVTGQHPDINSMLSNMGDLQSPHDSIPQDNGQFGSAQFDDQWQDPSVFYRNHTGSQQFPGTLNTFSNGGNSFDYGMAANHDDELPQSPHGTIGLSQQVPLPDFQQGNAPRPAATMATATVTISRPSSTDIKPTVPVLGQFRATPAISTQGYENPHHPSNAGHNQPALARSVSDDGNIQSPQDSVSQSSAHLMSAQHAPLAPSAQHSGPTSGKVVIPPRPKPGRKPLPQEDAQDRRRVQNRVAQRNFRDKRAQKVQELSLDLEKLRRESDEAYRRQSNIIQDHKNKYAVLARENESLKTQLAAETERATNLERELRSQQTTNTFAANGFPNPVLMTTGTGTGTALPPMTTNWESPAATATAASTNIMTPPDDEAHEAHEIDFTAKFMKPKPNPAPALNNVSPNRNKSNHNSTHTDSNTQNFVGDQDTTMHDAVQGDCGFCTDSGSFCPCAQAANEELAEKERIAQQEKEQLSRSALAPGGCDACIKDPERAAACRAIAETAAYGPRPASNNITARNDSMASAPSQSSNTMSCSKFIDRTGLPPQRVPSIAQLFGDIHAYPAMSPGSRQGYDVNEQEAARVLQDMARKRAGGNA